MASEPYSRVVIDRELREAGWNIEDENQVVFEDHGIVGRADYILKDKNGKAIALIEAKAPNIDPYTAKQQALNYVETQYKNQINYIYLANDHIIYFWDLLKGGDANPVPDFFSQDDLHRKTYQSKSNTAEPLMQKTVDIHYFNDIDPDFNIRPYHVNAWNKIASDYSNGKRSFLLEMATGTGKTVLTALIISKFLRTNNAQTVLFVVYRIELAGQTKGVFEKLLGNLSAVATYWGGSKKNLTGANVVVATIQSLALHGRKVFSPGYFDLIIHDEAHRSIYSPEARSALDYFIGATKIGLTATPKDFLKNIDIEKLSFDDPRAAELRIQRDTYRYFECEDGKATFRYTLQDGVKDGYLVPPKLHKMTSIITQEALSDQGFVIEGDFENESFSITDLEKRIIVPERNKLMMQEFLEYADKIPSGEIGKTIIFAVSQRHAVELEKILNQLKPEYNGRFAETITSRIPNAHDLARDFKHPDRKLPRVAVSVDMLTTGYDAPEVQNIVLARPVFEPTLYQQIKGRGTRLCLEINKTHFTIFDFCGVCAYFEEKYDWEAPLDLPTSSGTTYPPNPPTPPGVNGGTSNGPTCGGDKPTKPLITDHPDMVGKREYIYVGPEGDKVDREMYQDKWTDSVVEFINKHPDIVDALENEDENDTLIELINTELLNKPKEYFNEDTLSRSYRVTGTIIDFILAALHKKHLPTREQQIKDWEQGLIEKYGTEQGKPSQRKFLMVKLIAEQVANNEELKKNILTKPNIAFLQEHPFSLAYSVQEWLNTFGKDDLMNIIYDIHDSKILQI